jgi:hypothetical protein
MHQVWRIAAKLGIMKHLSLQGWRVLITQSGDFIGPALGQVFPVCGGRVA